MVSGLPLFTTTHPIARWRDGTPVLHWALWLRYGQLGIGQHKASAESHEWFDTSPIRIPSLIGT